MVDNLLERRGFRWNANENRMVAEDAYWNDVIRPGTYLDQKEKLIKYSDFVYKELILFSMADLQRSIPSITSAIDMDIRNLIQLGAVLLKNDVLNLTTDGLKLVRLGIEPWLGKLKFQCFEHRLGKEVLVLVAIMPNANSIFCRVGNEEDMLQFDHYKGSGKHSMPSANIAEATTSLEAVRWCYAQGIANATILTGSLLLMMFLHEDIKPPAHHKNGTEVGNIHKNRNKNLHMSGS
ncbi:hypothetical protein RHMOL_Rhmol04G0114300 [Rhododendron molle]|uniref:Uncharacterized protein n=2 Tax=Rhododendron molle TaxID=49168 RepID=A0ACC0NZB2_RHOML|nr:hypothetical protein RHMOL_Rhmol04G0114300 [Rhododendron molle]KAI8558665.1 hypothetical protein RHMOL_Rhmol04G0114300 [Rhododendron molle]